MKETRRTYLTTVLAGSAAGLAGCLDADRVDISTSSDPDSSDRGRDPEEHIDGPDHDGIPTADENLLLEYSLDRFAGDAVSGGVRPDGIPSIDDPKFEPISEAYLDPATPVFGVVRNGEAKAYPQFVLVWHEIVNDIIGGDPVAVTYCPLTGTVQGFERDSVTFGVSGYLVNANLIMFDRATESWWPQVLATAVDGEMRGAKLREFRVVWTRFGQWQEQHPDSQVLTPITGEARRYGDDPYGNYEPIQGYYAQDSTMFPPLEEAPMGHDKSVVIGARTTNGAIAFDKETLLNERVLTGVIPNDETPVVAVSDPRLSTGYVYRNPDKLTIEADSDQYMVGGKGMFAPDELPLDRVIAFDAMWFAWYGYYPTTEFVGEHTEAGYGK